MLTPLPSNNFAEVLCALAGDGIRELRAKLGVTRAAETDEEGVLISVKQNLTAKQLEEEPGQYGRLLRLHVGSFRDFIPGTSTSDGQFQGSDLNLGKSQGMR